MDDLEHVILTSDMPWDPDSIDDEYLVEDVQASELDLVPDYGAETVNDYGELLKRSSASSTRTKNVVTEDHMEFSDYVDACINSVHLVH